VNPNVRFVIILLIALLVLELKARTGQTDAWMAGRTDGQTNGQDPNAASYGGR